jgi:hypothetical protein
MTSSLETVFYSVLSLITVIKLSIIFVASKHNILSSNFIGYEILELTGSIGFSLLFIFSLLFTILITKLPK